MLEASQRNIFVVPCLYAVLQHRLNETTVILSDIYFGFNDEKV
jgi:hypothetical protein